MLGLVFGHTVYAVTTVLAAFMAGLGLGSWLFGRRAASFREPIRIYGLLEIAIGLFCALTPVLIWLASWLYPSLYPLLTLSYEAFSFTQFLLVFAILLVPTALMGGTLPVLSQAFVRDEAEIGRTVGLFYAMNTFGAVTGVFLAGYQLLPALGNRLTLAVAVVANLAVGAVAVAYGRRLATPARKRAAPDPVRRPAGPRDVGARLILIGLGVSGAVSMLYEVAWTRALAQVIGSSTYAFAAMLLAFLLGISGGAALYSRLWGARRASPGEFALIQCGIGTVAGFVLLTFDRFPALFLLMAGRSDSPAFVQFVQIAVSAVALLPPALLIGATFPCAVSAYTSTAYRAGEDAGRLYAANTAGAIVGAMLAGFVLIPAIGIQNTIALGIVINLVLGALLSVAWARPASPQQWAIFYGAIAVALAVTFIPSWNPRLMTSAPGIYVKLYAAAGGASLTDVLREREVLFYRDGPSATVAITKDGDTYSLRVNGKAEASNNIGDMPTQFMLGHLPLLIHPDPRRVLVIGLGSGVTAGAVARYPIERLDVVEIEPAVVHASKWFHHFNGNVLDDSRVRLVIADARNFLRTTPERYDVIISEPSNPWIGGGATLFSREFFQIGRDHLRPGGMMVQWVEAYGLSTGDLQTVVKTFGAVFGNTSVWHVSMGDYLLFGRTDPTPIDVNLMKARYQGIPAVQHDLERIGIPDWPGVFGDFMLNSADASRYANGARLNTDDRLSLEFSAPKALYSDTQVPNWTLMNTFKTADLPDLTPDSRRMIDSAAARYSIGMVYLGRQVLPYALAQFQKAQELDTTDSRAQIQAGRVSLRLERPSEALALARKVIAREPRNVDALTIAGLASMRQNSAEAVTFLQQAAALEPRNEEVRQALSKALLQSPNQ